jgi:gas vesicle protein
MMNSGKVVLGVLGGIIAGAAIGILFAPDKGSEIRSKIVKQGEDYLDSIKDRFNSLLDNISGMYNGGKVESSHVGEKSRSN